MKYCRPFLFAVYAALSSTADTTNSAIDSSTLYIIPGRGIPEVVELGMKPDEIDDAAHGLLSDKTGFGTIVYRIPHLGVMFGSLTNSLAAEIYFHVDSPSDELPTGFAPFRGSVSGGPSFSDGNITRSIVVGRFGEPKFSFHGMQDETVANVMDSRNRGDSCNWIGGHEDAFETIYYPRDGIFFNLVSGTVSRVAVTPKVSISDMTERESE